MERNTKDSRRQEPGIRTGENIRKGRVTRQKAVYAPEVFLQVNYRRKNYKAILTG